MNPHQYYQYQTAVSAQLQGVPGQAQIPYLASHPLTGGMHVAMPPPPPPTALALGQAKAAISSHPKLAEPLTENSGAIESSDINSVTSSTVHDSELENGESPELKTSQASLSCSTTTTAAVAESAVPTPVVLPPTTQAPSLVGGVYAGAYIQQAIPQPSTSMAASTGQYMVAPTAVPSSYPVQHGSKVMYIPHNYTGGMAGNPYVPPGGAVQPTIVTDQSGKAYILSNPYQSPVQYQVTPNGAVKPAAPAPAHQYVLASPQYYSNIPGSTGLQPVYGRMPGISQVQPVSPLGAIPGIAHNNVPVANSTPMYYYY